jgi:hypothetical protein
MTPSIESTVSSEGGSYMRTKSDKVRFGGSQTLDAELTIPKVREAVSPGAMASDVALGGREARFTVVPCQCPGART